MPTPISSVNPPIPQASSISFSTHFPRRAETQFNGYDSLSSLDSFFSHLDIESGKDLQQDGSCLNDDHAINGRQRRQSGGLMNHKAMHGWNEVPKVARETIKNILNGLQEQLCALSDHSSLLNSISTNIPLIEDSVEQLKISNERMEEEVKSKCDKLLMREVVERVDNLELGFENMLAAVGRNDFIEDSTGKVRNDKPIIAAGYSRHRKEQNQGDIPMRQHSSPFDIQGQPLSLLERIQRLEQFETVVNARLESLERTFKDQEESTLKRISVLESTHNLRMDKMKESIDKKVETADLDKFVKKDELKEFFRNAFLDTSKIIPRGSAKDACPSEVCSPSLASDDVEFDIHLLPSSSERNWSTKHPNSIVTKTDLDILADNLMKRVNVNLTNYAMHHELSSQLDNFIKRVQNELLVSYVTQSEIEAKLSDLIARIDLDIAVERCLDYGNSKFSEAKQELREVDGAVRDVIETVVALSDKVTCDLDTKADKDFVMSFIERNERNDERDEVKIKKTADLLSRVERVLETSQEQIDKITDMVERKSNKAEIDAAMEEINRKFQEIEQRLSTLSVKPTSLAQKMDPTREAKTESAAEKPTYLQPPSILKSAIAVEEFVQLQKEFKRLQKLIDNKVDHTVLEELIRHIATKEELRKSIEKQFDANRLKKRFEAVVEEQVDEAFGQLEKRIGTLRKRLDERFEDIDSLGANRSSAMKSSSDDRIQNLIKSEIAKLKSEILCEVLGQNLPPNLQKLLSSYVTLDDFNTRLDLFRSNFFKNPDTEIYQAMTSKLEGLVKIKLKNMDIVALKKEMDSEEVERILIDLLESKKIKIPLGLQSTSDNPEGNRYRQASHPVNYATSLPLTYDDYDILHHKLSQSFDEKLFLLASEVSHLKSLHHQTTTHPLLRYGQWIWTSSTLQHGSAIPWNRETVNTDPDNFKFTINKSTIHILEPGIYELTFAFFTKSKPSLQVVINGESVLSAIHSPSYVVHHGSGFVVNGDGIMKEGSVTGVNLIEFVCLPRKSNIVLHWHGKVDKTVEGFMGLRKLG